MTAQYNLLPLSVVKWQKCMLEEGTEKYEFLRNLEVVKDSNYA
jgi:hypothetical protein